VTERAVASTEIFEISVLVNDNDCDKKPSAVEREPSGFRITVKQPITTVR